MLRQSLEKTAFPAHPGHTAAAPLLSHAGPAPSEACEPQCERPLPRHLGPQRQEHGRGAAPHALIPDSVPQTGWGSERESHKGESGSPPYLHRQGGSQGTRMAPWTLPLWWSCGAEWMGRCTRGRRRRTGSTLPRALLPPSPSPPHSLTPLTLTLWWGSTRLRGAPLSLSLFLSLPLPLPPCPAFRGRTMAAAGALRGEPGGWDSGLGLLTRDDPLPLQFPRVHPGPHCPPLPPCSRRRGLRPSPSPSPSLTPTPSPSPPALPLPQGKGKGPFPPPPSCSAHAHKLPRLPHLLHYPFAPQAPPGCTPHPRHTPRRGTPLARASSAPAPTTLAEGRGAAGSAPAQRQRGGMPGASRGKAPSQGLRTHGQRTWGVPQQTACQGQMGWPWGHSLSPGAPQATWAPPLWPLGGPSARRTRKLQEKLRRLAHRHAK